LLGSNSFRPDDPAFTKARELLKDRLGDVVAKTREEFGDPLGMLMFYVAANEDAEKTTLLTGDSVPRLELSSAVQLAAKASD
jgi:hypothetical protein